MPRCGGGLFDLRILVRRALVYGLLLAFVLGSYSSAVFVVSQYLTEGAAKERSSPCC